MKRALGRLIACLALFVPLLIRPAVAREEPAPASGAQAAPLPPCEPWQEPDGHGGCQNRCPDDQDWNGSACVPKPPDCPEGTIDIQGNDRDDGGDDCRALDVVPVPALNEGGCVFAPNGTGNAICAAGLGDYRIQVAVGCLNVERTPFPRLMARSVSDKSGDEHQVVLRITGVLDHVLDPWTGAALPANQAGWYQVDSSPTGQVIVSGQFLHEQAGAPTFTSGNGLTGFDTRTLIHNGTSHRYPSINAVRIKLYFQTDNRFITTWDLAGLRTVDLPTGQEVRLDNPFVFSSFPDPRNGLEIVGGGLDRTRTTNTLPAFPLRVYTPWVLWWSLEYVPYTINGNAYVEQSSLARGGVGDSTYRLGSLMSARIWDARQSVSGAVADGYCQADDGYIPIPVLQGQSVLVSAP